MENKHDLKEVTSHFNLMGDYLGAAPYGSGHINDTYAVEFDVGGARVRHIIQRINHLVFRDPCALMENVERVTSHIRNKLKEKSRTEISRRVMTVIPTLDQQSVHRDVEGNYWRAYVFIEKAKTYDILTSADQAYEAAKAFGLFQKQLCDLNGPPLHETIPDFHNGKKRYENFLIALKKDSRNRAQSAKREIDFLHSQAGIFDIPKGLPWRTTHNDCKINNVLIDHETGEGICVIDLDTLMPGLALYDFGDMVRTSTCSAAEDEQDLDKVNMDMGMFKRLARGYLSEANGFLTRREKDCLAFSGKLITLIIGTRFLTDYLDGDVYFKVARDSHNLKRCRTQFQLARSIGEQEEKMQNFVNGI